MLHIYYFVNMSDSTVCWKLFIPHNINILFYKFVYLTHYVSFFLFRKPIKGFDRVWRGKLSDGSMLLKTHCTYQFRQIGSAWVNGLARFSQSHGYHDFQQFVTDGKRVGFVLLNDKELYWFLIGRVTWTGLHSCAMLQ